MTQVTPKRLGSASRKTYGLKTIRFDHIYSVSQSEPVTVPGGINTMSLHAAALAYAEAGWFVVPTSPKDIKNPGSLVGIGWPAASSRDADQINRWWTKWPDAGIALHAGRSGVVVFDLDVDDLAVVPVKYRTALVAARVQHTRAGDRGHYMFRVPEGESFGNGAGAFRAFGEVRGKNGVFIGAPTPHPADDGHYRWNASGDVPLLPDALRDCVRASTPGGEAEPLTREQLDAFYADHAASDRPTALDGVLALFEKMLEGNGSRHDALVNALPMAFRESIAGCYPAQAAADRIREAFAASFGGSPRPGHRSSPAPNEFARTAEWAAAQAQLADPAETLARIDRNDPARAVIDEEAFWAARPVLDHLRTFARSRQVSPWAMFGVVLARALTTVPPYVVLPKLVGSWGSLNTFVALVGSSGMGKGAAERAAGHALDTHEDVFTATVGSGEGTVKVFAYRTKPSDPQIGVHHAVLFSAAEVDNLATQGTRSGSTLLPTLRSAWSGEELGFSYADPTKTIRLKPHRYRLNLVVGVQPERARPLFDDADGGTPQRFLWLPVLDPQAPDEPPSEPAMWALDPWPSEKPVVNDDGRLTFDLGPAAHLHEEVDPQDLMEVAVPEHVASDIRRNRAKVLRGEQTDGLDAHGTLALLKVAAGLMYLDGRTDKINDEDWQLAGVVGAMSDRTRARVQQVLGAKASEANRNRGRAEGERAVAATETVEDARISRAVDSVRKHLEAAGELTRKAGRAKLRADIRDFFDDAADRLVAAGIAVKVDGAQGSYTLKKKSG
mgnify:CR=1 FL=1